MYKNYLRYYPETLFNEVVIDLAVEVPKMLDQVILSGVPLLANVASVAPISGIKSYKIRGVWTKTTHL